MKEYRYFVKKIDAPDNDLLVLELADISGGPVMNFKSGQYVMIAYRNQSGHFEDKHAFSIASSSTEQGVLRLGIRVMGKFTQGLAKLQVGDDVFVTGPFGEFVFDESKYFDAVFIAGGIGVTPFYSAIKYATDKGLKNKLTLLYSSRTSRGMTFLPELKEMQKINPNLSCLFSITDEQTSLGDPNMINERFSETNIQHHLGVMKGKTFFICGPGPFMTAMKNSLLNLGVEEQQVRMEEFSMIPDSKFSLKIKSWSYALSFSAVLFGLAFYVINQPVVVADTLIKQQSKFDPAVLYQLNKTVLDRLNQIYATREQSVTTLANQIKAAAKPGATNTPPPITTTVKTLVPKTTVIKTPVRTSQTVTTKTPAVTAPVFTQPVVSAPVVSAPAPVVSAPAPVVNTPAPAPTPTTKAS